MTSALRRLTGCISLNISAVAGGKEEAGFTTEFLSCSEPVFGTKPGSPNSDMGLPVLVQHLAASQADAEWQYTSGFERVQDPQGCGFSSGDPNISLTGGAKGCEVFPRCGKRSSPLPSNVTVRKRNEWFLSESDPLEDGDGGCQGDIPPSPVPAMWNLQEWSKGWVASAAPETRSAEECPPATW